MKAATAYSSRSAVGPLVLRRQRQEPAPTAACSQTWRILGQRPGGDSRCFAAAMEAGPAPRGEPEEATSWRQNLVTEQQEILALARSFKRVAVLGVKTEAQAGQPAFYVAQYLQQAGVDVVPVPTYYPDVCVILGQPVVRRVVDAGPDLDCVDVFRRPADVPAHVDDILAARPRCVWLQTGIRCPEAEEAFARAGIKVVADECLMVEHRRAARPQGGGGSSGKL